MRELLEKVIERFGKKHQLVVAMEEMAELQKELSKAIRGRQDINHITEEIADVEIMLEQLKIIFECSADVDIWKSAKLDRVIKRLERDEL